MAWDDRGALVRGEKRSQGFIKTFRINEGMDGPCWDPDFESMQGLVQKHKDHGSISAHINAINAY